jgi:hypothetical protein
MLGRMIRLAGKRSSNEPIPGETAATVSAAIANACEIASRFHPNALSSGSRKRLKVKGTMAAKLTITPVNAARTTCHPG